MREEDILIYEPQEAKKREEELREEELRRQNEIQEKDERIREEQRLREKTEEECESKIRNFAQERDDALKLLETCKEEYAAAAKALEAMQSEKAFLETRAAAKEQEVQRLTQERDEAQRANKEKSGNGWKKLSGIFIVLFALAAAGFFVQQNRNRELDDWNSRLLTQNGKLYAQCYFMDHNAGIVLVGDENDYYHTYSCKTTQNLLEENSSFWIRNGNNDDDNIYIGDTTYTPCPLCH